MACYVLILQILVRTMADIFDYHLSNCMVMQLVTD